MNKGKKFFLVSQVNSQLLREKFQKRLLEKGFIEEIPIGDDETILIEETNNNDKNATLKTVIINQLNDNLEKFTIKRIWKVNLEKEILGISSKNLSKTPECAILVLQEFNSEVDTKSYKLTIILIELKSSIKIDLKPSLKPERSEIEKKLIAGMNRLYMLLSLNNHLNPIQKYDHTSIYVEFRGVIIYNKTNIHDPNNNNPLCLIINHSTPNNILTVETILNDKDKIMIKCFPKQSQDSDEERVISLKDLLN